jgi:hypothetical protein
LFTGITAITLEDLLPLCEKENLVLYFKKLCPSDTSQEEKIKIWFLPAAPVFSFYCFDTIAILALLSHRRGLVEVPAFVCEKGGTLYDYIHQEFDFMIELARLVKEGGE